MSLWEKMLVNIQSEFKNKEGFLRHKTISKTMSPNSRDNTLNHLNYVRKNKYISNEVLPKVLDSKIGNPELTEGYSQGTAQHCHYLMVMSEYLGLKITDFDHITDVGGGYGNFYRMARMLGYEGNFDIADFPVIHEIQKYYINEHNLELPNFIGIENLNPNGKSILFGFHSINEMPLSDRKKLEEKYHLYDYIMMIYNNEFDGVDNFEYFENLKNQIGGSFTVEIIDAPLKSNGKFFMATKEKTRNPNNLLTYKRFDVVIKYMYASNLLSDFYKNAYKEHLKVWNGFREGNPKKVGFEEFDDAFKSIINNTVEEPVPLNAEGHIPNGAHRLAAALYHQRPINVRSANSDENYPILCDYKFFIKRGLSQHILKRTALEYAKLKSNTHVICLFPIAHTRIDEVMNIIHQYSNVFYQSSENLNSEGQLGLMKEIYLSDGWANERGIKKKSDQCFMGKTNVTFVLIDAKNLETVKEMKNKIRALFNVGNHSVHINDTHRETVRICKTVFNDNSIHFLNNRKNVLFSNYKRLMDDMTPDDNTVITGSTILSLYGLRDCKDIDLIYYNNPPADSHNQYLETHYKLTLDQIVNDPRYHLYYNGFKYVSLDVIKNMKKIRNEPKDIVDVQLIEKIKS